MQSQLLLFHTLTENDQLFLFRYSDHVVLTSYYGNCSQGHAEESQLKSHYAFLYYIYAHCRLCWRVSELAFAELFHFPPTHVGGRWLLGSTVANAFRIKKILVQSKFSELKNKYVRSVRNNIPAVLLITL